MNVAFFLSTLALLCGITASPFAHAVCLDPKTLISGYQITLDDEIRASSEIVIGKVTKSEPLQEDHTDSEGITAYIYKIRVLRTLKGQVPVVILLRTENDSGRYTMEVEEKHLLFLRAHGSDFYVDSCGNSSPLPQGENVLKQVEAKLDQAQKPNQSIKRGWLKPAP